MCAETRHHFSFSPSQNHPETWMVESERDELDGVMGARELMDMSVIRQVGR